MSDALGGVVNVGMIIFFVTVIALYMAFNVNYQKAFNVKNEVVSRYEEYNGFCGSECRQKIVDYEKKLGYRNIPLTENGDHCFSTLGYCVRGVEARKNSSSDSIINENIKYCYFDVRTLVYIDIQFINYFLKLNVFQVSGQTKAMKIMSSNSCDGIASSGG